MKIPNRFLAALFCLLALLPQAFADGVIAKTISGANLSAIVADHAQILGAERAGNSPFVRFEVDESDYVELIYTLAEDARIEWVQGDESFGSGPQGRSSHGSSVAAIFDPSASYDANEGIWEQINYNPIALITPWTPIKVGIVDTGISPYQTAILSKVTASASFVPGSTSVDDLPGELDTNSNGIDDEAAGHGTMVAGLIYQLAPASPLVIAKSADSDGIGSAWSVLRGVVYCIENGAQVINMSLGSVTDITAFSKLSDWAEAQGVLIVAPIGNNNFDNALFPSAYSKVVCVTGVDPYNAKATFSNWNSSALSAAPATGITSAWWDGGTATMSGTSLAAPIIVGCIAAMPITMPSPSSLRSALYSTGTNIDSVNSSYTGKMGRLMNFMALYSHYEP